MIGLNYIHRHVTIGFMSSGRFAEVRTPIILSILMVLMTQIGYLDLMNAWSGDDETRLTKPTTFLKREVLALHPFTTTTN